MAILQFTRMLAIVGALVPAVGNSSSLPDPIEGGDTLSQFCLMPEDRVETFRFYCRLGPAERHLDRIRIELGPVSDCDRS